MLRVLIVINRDIATGGIESYLGNTIEHMDLSGIDVDIFVTGKVSFQQLASKFEDCGCKIYEQSIVGGKVKRLVCFVYKLYRFLKYHNYDVIHINTGNLIQQAAALCVAELFGIPCRIAHSHNTSPKGVRLKKIANGLLHKIIVSSATELVSCSKAAAISMFGDSAIQTVIVAKNGIDISKFVFQQAARDRIRRQLELEECFVVGHVGRFAKQKNHQFLIRVFKRIAEKDPSARLLLIGEGTLEDRIHQLVDDYQLTDQVIFAGVTEKVEEFMCAMDVFVLPSVFEGLGIVNIEAQASGLPCVVSDAVPREARITHLIKFLPLEADLDLWTDEILKYSLDQYHSDRGEAWHNVYDAGYSIVDTAKALRDIYCTGECEKVI